jgi:rRNA maturation RNase YbeY
MKPASPASPATARELHFTNLQRAKHLNLRRLREITEAALTALPEVVGWNLTFYFVGARKMAGINESHLHHDGPTDVITFDYGDGEAPRARKILTGEIFICVDVAVTQAREFRTTWQSEVVRYVVHALLHLCGYDDLVPAARRRMKEVENRFVRKLAKNFPLQALSRAGTR